jgi:hypothetical protein
MFRVEWLQSALDELTLLWLQAGAAVRQAMTAAVHAIDRQLQTDPENQGESRSGGQRVLFVPPLGVLFEVDAAQRVVTILHVWRFRQHP